METVKDDIKNFVIGLDLRVDGKLYFQVRDQFINRSSFVHFLCMNIRFHTYDELEDCYD
jgi:hypothetical protein